MKLLPKLIITTSLLFVGGVNAQTSEESQSKQAVSLPNFFISGDSVGFGMTKVGGAYLPKYEHGDSYLGVNYQFNHYNQNGWVANGNQAGLIAKDINSHTGLGYVATLGVNTIAGSSLLVTDSSYGFKATDSTRIELLLNRDRVETQGALTNNIYYTLIGGSVEQQIIDRLSVVGMVGNMYFSDTNTRPFFRAKIIYDLWPDYGLTAQLRYRQYRDTNTNVANNYFNPDTYNEGMFVLGMKKRYEAWVFSGTAGIGRQTVNSDTTTTTQLLEMSATSPFTNNIFFRARAGYGKSAGFNGPDYTYTYFLNELIFSF